MSKAKNRKHAKMERFGAEFDLEVLEKRRKEVSSLVDKALMEGKKTEYMTARMEEQSLLVQIRDLKKKYSLTDISEVRARSRAEAKEAAVLDEMGRGFGDILAELSELLDEPDDDDLIETDHRGDNNEQI